MMKTMIHATRSSFALAALALLALSGEAMAERASGSQMPPDSSSYLINKDVGAERWAIYFNLRDRTVSGNVFKVDGSPPSFVWCKITSETPAPDPANNQYVLDCYGADRCEAAPCSDTGWKIIQSGIPISGSFLLPPATQVTFKGDIEPVFDAKCSSAGCHSGTTPSQGLNLAPGVAYDAIFRVPATEDDEHLLVEPFDSEVSHLYGKLTGEEVGAQMPLGAPPLPDATIESFRRWILEGAARN